MWLNIAGVFQGNVTGVIVVLFGFNIGGFSFDHLNIWSGFPYKMTFFVMGWIAQCPTAKQRLQEPSKPDVPCLGLGGIIYTLSFRN